MPPEISIRNTISIGCKQAKSGLAIYNVAKAAVINFTQATVVCMVPNMLVNCVCPVSAVTTLMHLQGQNFSKEFEKSVVTMISAGRRVTP
jgi:NAD(P)-dependent dehydrogenase (short-subunit alcohol dehydrogenase family)